MKLRIDDIAAHLKQSIMPIYIVSGDEPLQVSEACDAIRRHAVSLGFSDRHVLYVDRTFDWSQLTALNQSMSLFADKQLIELRMSSAKPGDKGAKVLIDYAASISSDNVLLIMTGKVDAASQKSKWFGALEKTGVFIQAWPIEERQLPGWINQRMRSRGLKPTGSAVGMLVERVEGNLLAAAQEVEKLLLLYGEGVIDEEKILQAVSDSARYDVYGLVDVALSGNVIRLTRMLTGLQAEGVEAVLVLWALTREIRALVKMSLAVTQGMRVEQVVAQQRTWPKRQPLLIGALKRTSSAQWQDMIQHAARTDCIIKGMVQGDAWDSLMHLALLLAGKPAVGVQAAV